jgi:integrase
MVFRRKGRKFFEAKVPKKDGTWSNEPTGTNDKVTAAAIEEMIRQLQGREAWALLEAVTNRPRRWTLAELNRLWRATPVRKFSPKTGKPMQPSRDERIEYVEAQLVEVDIDPLVDTFHKVLAREGSGVSVDTADHYRAAVRRFVPEGTPCHPSALNERALRVWIEEMDDVKPGTVRKRGIGMGRFTEWLVGRGVLGIDPMREIAFPAQGDPLAHYLEVEDAMRLADTLSGQMCLYEYLLPATGIEVSTALALRVRAVSTIDHEIHAPGTKTTSRNRVVYVADFGWPAVLELLKGKHPDSLLFDRIRDRWEAGDAHRDAVKALGEKGYKVFVEWEGKPKLYTLRDHRHTWAVRAVRSGTPIGAVADQLGHSDKGVLALKYLRTVPTEAGRARPLGSDGERTRSATRRRAASAGRTMRYHERHHDTRISWPRVSAPVHVLPLGAWRARGESKTHNAGVAGSSPAPAIPNKGAQLLTRQGVIGAARLLASVLGLRWGTTRGTKGAPAGCSKRRSACLRVVRGDAA